MAWPLERVESEAGATKAPFIKVGELVCGFQLVGLLP